MSIRHLLRHSWYYWKDPAGEGGLCYVYWDTHSDNTRRGVDRRTCRVCAKTQRYNYKGPTELGEWYWPSEPEVPAAKALPR